VLFRSGQRTAILSLALLAPALAGCGGGSDLLSKDAEWFARPSRMFNRTSLALETPPLSADRPVTPEDLITSDGVCAGMVRPEASAMTDGATGATSGMPGAVSSGIALGQTECDVARAAGSPDSVNLSGGERGERVAVLTYMKGPRPGIYRFSEGRLTSIERGPEPPPPARPVRNTRQKSRAG
jgi:hypothetical protein